MRTAGFPAVYIQVSCLGTVSAIGNWALKIQIVLLLGVPHKPRGDGWKRNKFLPKQKRELLGEDTENVRLIGAKAERNQARAEQIL